MNRFNQVIDLNWSLEGDFTLGPHGDLESTDMKFKYKAFIQKLRTRIESSYADWPLLRVGANLGNSLGMSNSPETAAFIERQVNAELQRDGFLQSKEYQLDIFPISNNAMQMIIIVTPPGSKQTIILNYQYLLRDNRVIPRFLETPL